MSWQTTGFLKDLPLIKYYEIVNVGRIRHTAMVFQNVQCSKIWESHFYSIISCRVWQCLRGSRSDFPDTRRRSFLTCNQRTPLVANSQCDHIYTKIYETVNYLSQFYCKQKHRNTNCAGVFLSLLTKSIFRIFWEELM